MRTEDLMINDWVNVNGNPEQVKDIIASDFGINPYWERNEYHNIKNELMLSPIPITPEILEKNGFTLEWDGWHLRIDESSFDNLFIQFRHNGEVRLVEGEIQNQFFFKTRMIKNVHELQHQMRMMGIDKEIIV